MVSVSPLSVAGKGGDSSVGEQADSPTTSIALTAKSESGGRIVTQSAIGVV